MNIYPYCSLNKSLLAVSILACFTLPTLATTSDTIEMTDSATLGGSYSSASLMSADGTVIIGDFETSTGANHAFKYTAATGIVDLGTLGGSANVSLISTDGQVIVGQSDTLIGDNHVFKHTDASGMVDLGTLGGGYSNVNAMSADGGVIAGSADTATGENRAFKHTDATGMVDLGTLGGTNSSAIAVSADGRVIVGQADIAGGGYLAFKHTDATGMLDLGSLGGDYSHASLTSANGSVTAGYSDTVSGERHAFKHTDASGMVDLGTLGGSGSYADLMSADGSVIAGQSETASGDLNAFKHTDASGMVNLGNLGGGNSFVSLMSADGRVIAGQSYLSTDDERGYKHTDATGMVDLGTLGGMASTVNAMSADGSVIVGQANIATGEEHAFKHTDALGMIDLGTLGGSNSSALAISADGSVIAGQSDTSTGEQHAVIWKIIKAEDPNQGGGTGNGNGNGNGNSGGEEVITIDVDNTRTAMSQSASRAQKILDIQSLRLDKLAAQECLYTQGNACVGAYTGYRRAKKLDQANVGVTFGLKLNQLLRIGATLDHNYHSDLGSNYQVSGNSRPGMGIFVGYRENIDESGWNGRLSAAYLRDKIDIRREILSHTEAGKGRSELKGYKVGAELGYTLALDNTLVTPYGSLEYHKIERSAYRETQGAVFAAQYDRMGETRTSLGMGSRLTQPLSSSLNFEGDVGLRHDLNNQRDGYVARMEYLGVYDYGKGKKSRTRPYAGVGLSYQAATNMNVRVTTSWEKQSYGSNGFDSQLSVGFSF
ncbi:HAF repeat-containing protein [Pragia fontium]|uniref:HAF repeat-containing protein n=1 Tax=Pragia fontium TaxID=82985 RepID=UPI00069C82AB|nr:HAF repeat-containing protein [Pragia fontium]